MLDMQAFVDVKSTRACISSTKDSERCLRFHKMYSLTYLHDLLNEGILYKCGMDACAHAFIRSG